MVVSRICIHPLVSSVAKCLREKPDTTRHIARSIKNTSFLPHPFLINYNINTIIRAENEFWIKLLFVYKSKQRRLLFEIDFRPLRLSYRIRCERRWYVCCISSIWKTLFRDDFFTRIHSFSILLAIQDSFHGTAASESRKFLTTPLQFFKINYFLQCFYTHSQNQKG